MLAGATRFKRLYCFHFSGRSSSAKIYDQAIDQYRKALELDPNFVPAHWQLGRTVASKGRTIKSVCFAARRSNMTRAACTGLGE